jgi:hypothetical protein
MLKVVVCSHMGARLFQLMGTARPHQPNQPLFAAVDLLSD